MFIVPVCAVLCYKVAKYGFCPVCKKRKSTPFTYDVFVFLKLDGNKKSPTRKCREVLDSTLCILPSASAGFADLVMFWEWVTSESQSLCCTASWLMEDAKVVGFKDVCKRDLKSWNVSTDNWEGLTNDRDKWRSSIYISLKEREKELFKRPK